MESFNQLTPSQAEKLAILLEEMGEAQQAIGKILRHGYESFHPRTGIDNRSALERELGDVLYAMLNLCKNNDLHEDLIHFWSDEKATKIQQYLHHNE